MTRSWSSDDRAVTSLAVFGFSLALGTATLVVPLLALAAGYDPAIVGLLAATSAISQFALRAILPWVLERHPDRDLMMLACAMIAASYGLLILTRALPLFVVAQLLQGGARALFWTSSQTHAVRGEGGSVRNLARVQLVNSVGSMIGPALAGVTSGVSLDLALAVGAGAGLAAGAFARLMRDLPPFIRQPRHEQPRIWRRSGVDLACWAGFTAGGWRAMQGSYIPIVLHGWGLAPSLIGLLLASADAAATGVAAVLVRFTPRSNRSAIEVGVVAIAVGLAALPLTESLLPLAAALILMAGMGSGILITVGPAHASDSVGPEERGEALAVVGMFRAASLLATPAGVAVGLAVVTLPVGMTIAGVALAIPALAAGIGARRSAITRGAT